MARMIASAEEEELKPLLEEIHRYWFGALTSPTDLPEDKKGIWFQQSDVTDTYIREHFGHAIPRAAVLDWNLSAMLREEQVGLVVLLDQFPRNIFRNSPRAFAYDDKARSISRRLLDGGRQRFALIERMFLAIPFEHSEAIADQDYSIWLMAGIAIEATGSFPEYARWALDSFIKHRNLIRRFGRFPHRNEVCGRASTHDELLFLAELPRGDLSNPIAGAALHRKSS